MVEPGLYFDSVKSSCCTPNSRWSAGGVGRFLEDLTTVGGEVDCCASQTEQ